VSTLPRRWRSRLDPNEQYGLRLTLVALAILIVAIPFAYLVFDVIGSGPLSRFDGRLANSLNAWAHDRPTALHILEAISLMAKPITLWVVAGIVAAWLWRAGRPRIAIFVVVTSLGGGLLDTLVKIAVDRPRPVVDHPVATALGKSFPSGHTMGATVVYGAFLVAFWTLLSKRWRVVALAATTVGVLAVGSSRLLLGVHFLTDVVGSFLLGLAWLAGSSAAFETWRHDLAVEEVNERAEARARAGPSRRVPDERVG
jgi:undecaprenyl-diphosphatase